MDTQPDAYRVKTVAKRLDISERSVYRRVSSGDIPAIRLGSTILITRETIERLLSGELEATG